MEFIKEEINLVHHVLKVEGYKSSRKIKLLSNVFMLVPDIRFADSSISHLNFQKGTFKVACQVIDLAKVKRGINQLSGKGGFVDVLRNNTDISINKDLDIFVDTTIEESDSFYIYNDKVYKKSQYKLVKNINKVPRIFAVEGGYIKYIRYNGYNVGPENNIHLIIKKLKIIQAIFDKAREILEIKN